ncbi:MAG: hypothetical protein KBH60_03025, partial [Alistipes sp.]|nr:hypothetical protein [Alistipes sp.]
MFISIELRFLEFVESVINTNIIIYPDTVLSRTGRYTAQKIPAAPHSPPALRQRKTERSEAFETLRIFAPSRLCACGVQRITAPLRAEVVV